MKRQNNIYSYLFLKSRGVRTPSSRLNYFENDALKKYDFFYSKHFCTITKFYDLTRFLKLECTAGFMPKIYLVNYRMRTISC